MQKWNGQDCMGHFGVLYSTARDGSISVQQHGASMEAAQQVAAAVGKAKSNPQAAAGSESPSSDCEEISEEDVRSSKNKRTEATDEQMEDAAAAAADDHSQCTHIDSIMLWDRQQNRFYAGCQTCKVTLAGHALTAYKLLYHAELQAATEELGPIFELKNQVQLVKFRERVDKAQDGPSVHFEIVTQRGAEAKGFVIHELPSRFHIYRINSIAPD